MARQISFEGRTIVVPDDATDDEVRGIIGAATPQAKPEPKPAASASDGFLSDLKSAIFGGGETQPTGAKSDRGVMGVVDQGVRGLVKGGINLATLPIDASSMTRSIEDWALHKAGVPDAARSVVLDAINPVSKLQPYIGGDAISSYIDRANRATADVLGVERPVEQPQNAGERVVNRVAQEVGAAALPIGGAVVKGGQIGVDAARKLPTLVRMFVEPAAINPARFMQREMTTAAAAGLGAAGAGEVAHLSGLDPAGAAATTLDIAGALGGAGALGAVRVVGRPVSDIAKAVLNSDKFTNKAVKENVVDQLANNADTIPKIQDQPLDTRDLVAAIEGGRRVEETIPGFRESLADRTGDSGLAALEYGRQMGRGAGAFVERRNQNTAAVDQAIGQYEPQGRPADFRGELDLERNRRLSDAATAREVAQAEVEAASQRLVPTTPYAEDRGQAVRAGLEAAENTARAGERQAWAGMHGQADPAPLAEAFDATTAGMPIARRQLVQDLEGALGIPGGFEGGPVNFDEITALRSRLTTAQRNALRGPQPDENRAEAIGRYVAALDEYMAGHLPDNLLAQYDQARGVSRNVNERFNRPNDPLSAVLSRKEGRPDVPDSGVTRRFIQPDSRQTSNLDRLLAETDMTSHAQSTRQAVRDELLADVQARGLVNRPDQLTNYLDQRSALLGRFPGLRDELESAGAAARRVQQTTADETVMQRDLGTADRAGTSSIGKYLKYGDERAQDAMQTVLSSAKPGQAMDELLRFVNDDPKAVEGARKAFWDILQKRGRSGGETTKMLDGAQPWMPNRLNEFLNDPATAAVAERLWRDNPEHLANVRKIADELQSVDLRGRAKAPNTSGTPQGISNVLTPETLQSRLYAYKRGQTSLGFMLTAIGSVAARRAVRSAQADAIEKLLDKALLDPDLAAQLLKENNPANRAALARTTKAYLGNTASHITDLFEERDPVKDAIERKP